MSKNGYGDDGVVPSDSLLNVTRESNEVNSLGPRPEDGYVLSLSSKDGLKQGPVWDVPYRELPDSIKEHLVNARNPFSTLAVDLDRNNDVKNWLEVEYDRAKPWQRQSQIHVDNPFYQEDLDKIQRLREAEEKRQSESLGVQQNPLQEKANNFIKEDLREPVKDDRPVVDRQREMQSLDINRKVDGKYTMTAVFNGTAVTRDVSASTVQSLKNATPDEKVSTVAQIFNRPELKDPAISESVKERVTEAVAQVTQSATPESVSRPEIYVSKSESVSDIATSMQAAAAASYSQSQSQQQSEEQSQTQTQGRGM